MQLDLGLLIAGAKERGELESRVTGLLSEIRAAGDVVLMCVPDPASWNRHSSCLCQSCTASCRKPRRTCLCCVLCGLHLFQEHGMQSPVQHICLHPLYLNAFPGRCVQIRSIQIEVW